MAVALSAPWLLDYLSGKSSTPSRNCVQVYQVDQDEQKHLEKLLNLATYSKEEDEKMAGNLIELVLSDSYHFVPAFLTQQAWNNLKK